MSGCVIRSASFKNDPPTFIDQESEKDGKGIWNEDKFAIY